MTIGRHCIQVLLWLFLIWLHLYWWNVLILGENAKAFLSCPTSSFLPGTGWQFQCQHACLWCMVIYFCCMFIYLIKMCWEIHHGLFTSFVSRINVKTSTTGWCGWLYFLLLLLFNWLIYLIYRHLLGFFKVCCFVWTVEICIRVHLNSKVLKELGNGLTDVCIFWFSFLSHSLIL